MCCGDNGSVENGKDDGLKSIRAKRLVTGSGGGCDCDTNTDDDEEEEGKGPLRRCGGDGC